MGGVAWLLCQGPHLTLSCPVYLASFWQQVPKDTLQLTPLGCLGELDRGHVGPTVLTTSKALPKTWNALPWARIVTFYLQHWMRHCLCYPSVYKLSPTLSEHNTGLPYRSKAGSTHLSRWSMKSRTSSGRMTRCSPMSR